MSELEKDSFEEFLKDSLENYTSDDAPNWSEMENRLDTAKGGSPSGSGVINSTILKWIAAAVVVGGLSMLVINLMTNDDPQNSEQTNTGQESFINRIRALTLSDDVKESDESGTTSSDKNISDNISTKEANGEESTVQNVAGKELHVTNKDESAQVVFTKPVPVVYNGRTLDMLRAANQNNSIPDLPDPIAVFSAEEKQGCVPLSIRFNLHSQDVAMKYLWDFGDGTMSVDANPIHTYTETGQFIVELTVTSLINQKAVTMISNEPVTVFGRPEVSFEREFDEHEVGSEVTFMDYSSDVLEWEWNFGDLSTSDEENPTHQYKDEGTYIVELVGTDINGCKDTMTSTIKISGKHLTNGFFAENSFTPNGDGRNDIFKPMINGPQTINFEMSIMTRKGTLIFETDDMNQGWDGRLGSGETAPQDAYIWLIIVNDDKGNYEKHGGVINLFK